MLPPANQISKPRNLRGLRPDHVKRTRQRGDQSGNLLGLPSVGATSNAEVHRVDGRGAGGAERRQGRHAAQEHHDPSTGKGPDGVPRDDAIVPAREVFICSSGI